MTKRVFLHVGLPKSGTTYLQAVLHKNKPRLKAQANLLYPGRAWADQVAAVRDLRGMRVPARDRASVKGRWARIVGEIADWDGDSVFSMEWLCAATPQQIRRLESDLAPARVEVAFTLRDLGRTLPAAWQEFVQNRQEWPWDDFLKEVAAADLTSSRAARAFWAQQDAARLVEVWSRCLSPGQVHVVTAPPAGADPSVLWKRFCRALDLEDTGYEIRDVGSNDSLGWESAEMMRRLNAVTRSYGVDRTSYNKMFKRRMAKDALSQRKRQESKLTVPPEHHSWVRACAREQIAALESLGVEVIGDTQDLVPDLDSDTTQAGAPDVEAVLDAALHGCVAVVTRNEAELRRLRKLVEQPDGLRGDLAALQRELADLQGHVDWVRARPVRAALSTVSRRNRVLGLCRRLYVRVRSLLTR